LFVFDQPAKANNRQFRSHRTVFLALPTLLMMLRERGIAAATNGSSSLFRRLARVVTLDGKWMERGMQTETTGNDRDTV
jgi:hypothetical protein